MHFNMHFLNACLNELLPAFFKMHLKWEKMHVKKCISDFKGKQV